MAIFRSATTIGSHVILTELQKNGNNFVVAIETNKKVGKIKVNSIRSIHPRQISNIVSFIEDNLMDYADKNRMLELITDKKKNRFIFGSTPANAIKRLNSVAKIIKSFQNPSII